MEKERIQKLFEACDEVITNDYWFVKEKNGTWTLYEDGLETMNLSEQGAISKLIRLIELCNIKTVGGVIHSEEVLK
jgi:hypothetical protein